VGEFVEGSESPVELASSVDDLFGAGSFFGMYKGSGLPVAFIART
jgi:hypothetical protein